jgi:hypothetical protein
LVPMNLLAGAESAEPVLAIFRAWREDRADP